MALPPPPPPPRRHQSPRPLSSRTSIGHEAPHDSRPRPSMAPHLAQPMTPPRKRKQSMLVSSAAAQVPVRPMLMATARDKQSMASAAASVHVRPMLLAVGKQPMKSSAANLSNRKCERPTPLSTAQVDNRKGTQSLLSTTTKVDVELELETMKIPDREDAAFVCGKGGGTIRRIALVANCKLCFRSELMLLEIRGSPLERRQARLYAKFMIAQRKAKNDPVPLERSDVENDCTIMNIPKEVMAYLLGSRGATLRRMEQEYNVIMFVGDVRGAANLHDTESLCIFGNRRSRRRAQLEVMSTVESKVPNYFIGSWLQSGETFEQESDRYGDWDTSIVELEDPEVRFLTGTSGRTRKTISAAADCIVQSVGCVVFLSGTAEQRSRAEDYMGLILNQIGGAKYSPHVEALFTKPRDDRTLLEIPKRDVGYVTGKGRETMSQMEDEYGVVMMFLQSLVLPSSDASTDTLAIFGPLRNRRSAELEVMASAEHNDPGVFTTGCHDQTDSTKDFATDRITFQDKGTIGYILGKAGSTRRRLSKASGAHLQFVGNILHIAGTFDERIRGRHYLDFHLQVEKRSDSRINVSGRSDVTIVDTHGLRFTGPELWKIEEETGTFCLVAPNDKGVQQFFIFGKEEGDADHSGRAKAKKMAMALFKDKKKGQSCTVHGNARSRTPARQGQSGGPQLSSVAQYWQRADNDGSANRPGKLHQYQAW